MLQPSHPSFRFRSVVLFPLMALLPAPAVAQTPINVPSAKLPERSPEERLEQGVRNLFELLAEPDPRYQTFVHFTDKTRLWFVMTSGGLADAELTDGQVARDILAAMFGPESGITPSFGAPDVTIDGAFGRATLPITVHEGTKPPECGTAYVDAVLEPPGPWAKTLEQGLWRFTQITLSFEKFRKCPA
ncbi:hypothetical protein [Sphingopyxis sp.]|uniref:hypothetical protein n=1 Tax=Sphingopyxis sp. TaxID=1908224 RepID=UPI002D782BF1|nr:hypothetical protein [Sphingopyxis sp.]HET6526287.1 hypothetical protein [Sphingopyxis sp.]